MSGLRAAYPLRPGAAAWADQVEVQEYGATATVEHSCGKQQAACRPALPNLFDMTEVDT